MNPASVSRRIGSGSGIIDMKCWDWIQLVALETLLHLSGLYMMSDSFVRAFASSVLRSANSSFSSLDPPGKKTLYRDYTEDDILITLSIIYSRLSQSKMNITISPIHALQALLMLLLKMKRDLDNVYCVCIVMYNIKAG